jgi:hypothetical protein
VRIKRLTGDPDGRSNDKLRLLGADDESVPGGIGTQPVTVTLEFPAGRVLAAGTKSDVVRVDPNRGA